MFRLGKLYYTSRGFDLLASLKKSNLFFTRNKFTKQLAFLIIPSSSPSLRCFAQIFKPLVLAESPYFHGLWFFYLRREVQVVGRWKTHEKPNLSEYQRRNLIGSFYGFRNKVSQDKV